MYRNTIMRKVMLGEATVLEESVLVCLRIKMIVLLHNAESDRQFWPLNLYCKIELTDSD